MVYAQTKILIVDDEPDVLLALEDALEDEFTVVTASSASIALTKLQQGESPEVILSDQRMPEMTGDEFFTRAKRFSKAVRILVTGYADIDAVVRAVNQGKIFGYVSKPWDRNGLRLLVMKAVEAYCLNEELQLERDLLHHLMNNIPDAIYFKDEQRRIIRANSVHARRLRVDDPSTLIGQRDEDICSETESQSEIRIAAEKKLLDSGEPIREELIKESIDSTGRSVFWSMNNFPIRNEDGGIQGMVAVLRDVTALQNALESLRQREAGLKQAEKIAQLCHRIWQVSKDCFSDWSQSTTQLLSISWDKLPQSLDHWFALVAEKDLARIQLEYQCLLEQKTAQKFEYDLQGEDLKVRRIHEICEPLRFNDDGSVAEWFSTIQDVTEMRQKELELTVLLELSQALGEANSIGEVLQTVIDHVCEEFQCSYGEAWLPDKQGRTLKLADQWYGDKARFGELRKVSQSISFSKGEGIQGMAWQQNNIIFIDDIASSEHKFWYRQQQLVNAKLTRMLVAPVTDSDNNLIATIGFGLIKTAPFGAAITHSLQGITSQLGISLEKVNALADKRKAELRLSTLAQNLPGVLFSWVTVADNSTHTKYVSPGIKAMFGFTVSDVLASNYTLIDLTHPDDRNRIAESLALANASLKPWSSEHRFITRTGETRWGYIRSVPSLKADNSVSWDGVILDITQRKQAEERLNQLTSYDPVTGLASRKILMERLVELNQRQQSGQYCLALLRLVNYDQILDGEPEEVANELLRNIGCFIKSSLTSNEIAAITGPAEFAVVLLRSPGRSTSDLEKIINRLNVLDIDGQQVFYLQWRAGMTGRFLSHCEPVELYNQSRLALRAAESGRKNIYLYSDDLEQSVKQRVALEKELRIAVRERHLQLYFQPQILLASGRMAGAEVLLRWPHAELGMISPVSFIPIAEQTNLINQIGAWVLRKACEKAHDWYQQGATDFHLAVNVSAIQLSDENFVELVKSTIREACIPPSLIELEITESSIMTDLEIMCQRVKELKESGLFIALDDFGTGYSSLSQMKTLPLDRIKIDKSFVDGVLDNPADVAMIKSIIAISKQLDLEVIAEGAETQQQVTLLKRLDIDICQGYYFSRPITEDEFAELLISKHKYELPQRRQSEEVTILCLDDDKSVLKALNRSLRGTGYNILLASEPTQAFEVLAEHDVDIVLCDQRMPGLNGSEFLKRLKELYPQTIRIILTGYTNLNAVTEAVNTGEVFRFLTKPWNSDELLKVLKDAIAAKRQN